MTFERIGVIHSEFDEPGDPHEMRQHESTVVVDEAYEEGLYRIEHNDHVTVLFHIHEGSDYTLKGPRLYGEERGTFACRSPHRPNPIGTTTVELLDRDGRELRVDGLDAIDGTPLLDLKPHAPSLDCPDREPPDDRRADPRTSVRSAVRGRDIETLVFDAGTIHGHYCPELSVGVMAGVYARRELGAVTADVGDLLAITETNGCFADGTQYVTGCTFGNGGLIYRDYGKMAVTLVRRSEPDSGIRVRLQNDYVRSGREQWAGLRQSNTNSSNATVQSTGSEVNADAAFGLVGRPLGEFCDIETDVSVRLPQNGDEHSRERVVCVACDESVRRAKTVEHDGERRCVPCAKAPYQQLDGRGLARIECTSDVPE
jgi:formylmethanofuran dehydrogenase subunit E